MRLLDLYAGGGGAAVGYHRAGFEVVGVDIERQPDYPFKFVQGDVLDVLTDGEFIRDFDVVHASPPCQMHSITANLARAQGKKASTVNLIPPTREWLREHEVPYVIENVPRSPLINPIELCGSMFGLRVRRHRWFESNLSLFAPDHPRHQRGDPRPVGVYGSPKDDIPHGGSTARDLADGQDAMGIDWLPWSRLKEAIPPAYTEYLGCQLIGQLGR